jgi:cytochrome P450
MAGKSLGGDVAFDPLDWEMRRNAPATYAAMRERCPVARSTSWGGFWTVARYEDVFAAARDPATFSSASGVLIPPLASDAQLLPMESDPPFHSDLRRALIGFFSPRQIEPLEPLVRRLADDLLDPVLTEGIHDLSRDYAWRIPTAMTCHLLGLTELDQFHEWAEQIVYGRGEDSASSAAASRAAWSYIDGVVEARESRPGTDLISTVLGVRVRGRRLSRKEAVDTVFFLFLAGLDNTAFAIRASLLSLAEDRSLRERLREEPALLSSLVEEWLRLSSPVPGLCRLTTRDVEIGGVVVPAGERVFLLWGSANRDPQEFADADALIADRLPNRHMAFGVGIHRCLGAPLARLEIRVAVEQVLTRARDLDFDFELTASEQVEPIGLGPLPIRFVRRNATSPVTLVERRPWR